MEVQISETWLPPSSLAEDLLTRYGLTCPPRWGTPRDPSRKTTGPKVAAVMRGLGLPPMPHQRYVLDVALEQYPDGMPVYNTVIIALPRQQGKTGMALGLMTHRAYTFPAQNIVYTAQDRAMATQRLSREFFAMGINGDHSAFRGKARYKGTTGFEQIYWDHNQSVMKTTANTDSAGHGPPQDLVVNDEIFSWLDLRLDTAFSPALVTRPHAQRWLMSAAGKHGDIWDGKRKAARLALQEQYESGVFQGLAFFDWSASDSANRLDESVWKGTLPAMCPEWPCQCGGKNWHHTIPIGTIRSEVVNLAANGGIAFDRAYLNLSTKPIPRKDENVPRQEWAASADIESRIAGERTFAVDTTPNREYTTITVAGLGEDGRWHLEVVERRRGTAWAVPALARLKDVWDPIAIAIDRKGQAIELKAALAEAGIALPVVEDEPKRGDLFELSTAGLLSACGSWASLTRDGSVVHIDQPMLSGAVFGAVTAPVGDRWYLSRRYSPVDICPLVGVVMARFAHECWAGVAGKASVYDPVANIA